MKHEKSRVERFGNGRLVKGARLTKAGSLQPKPSMIGTRLGRYRKLG